MKNSKANHNNLNEIQMAQIEDLQNLDLEKIKSGPLKTAIEELLQDYEQVEEKESFQKAAKENINKLFMLIKNHAPDAVREKEEEKPSKEQEEEEAKETEKKNRKEKSRKAMEEVKEIGEEIEGCRKVIREFNKQKREAEGTEPPKKKNRLTKLKDKLLGIIGLIPEKLREDKTVRDKTEKILLDTLHELKKSWGMNKVKQAEDAIKLKFNTLDEQQAKKEERQKAA
jgi:hypothetical protein